MTLNTQSFSYSGRKYSFVAIAKWAMDDPTQSVALDASHIDSFYYSNEMNSLFLRGYLEYTDTNGLVDVVLGVQHAFIDVEFYEMDVESDNAVVVEYPSDKMRLSHEFYISSLQVLDRQSNQVKYRFNLVSRNWFNCTSRLAFSNYAQKKQDVVEILAALLEYAGMTPDQKTFGRVKTGVELNYIAGVNDTCQTAASYLLSKLYYYRERAERLLFMVYDEHLDKFEMFDSMDRETWYSQYVIPVTFFKNQIENLAQSEPINFATVVKFPRTKTHEMLHNVKMYDFNQQSGCIRDVAIGTKTIQKDYLNSLFGLPEYDKNLRGLYHQVQHALEFNRYSSYWNNGNSGLEISLYDEMARNFEDSNSLVVNVAGSILRKPGSLVDIEIDRDVKNATGDDHSDMELFKNQYKAYEGRWFVTRVQTFLNLTEYRYTQNLVCSRNFVKT